MTEPVVPPTAPGIVRKLATILSADVAGYSRLMARDEEQTLLTFRSHSAIFEALVTQHRGRVFNRAGDAILAEFDSAVEAVRCATDIQSALATRNSQLPEERQVRFRIGINIGDVLLQGDDLLGDGVNIAARLQTAAAPGGICLSGTVYDQIRNKLSLAFKPLGDMTFKNIPLPVRTFAIIGDDSDASLPSPSSVNHRRLAVTIVVGALAIGGIAIYLSLFRHLPAPQEATSLPDSTLAGSVAPVTQSDGLYGGPICYGASAEDPARCYRGEGMLEHGHIRGQWKGRDVGVTVFLSGVIAASGEAEIELHGEKSDGSRTFMLDLTGRLGDGKLNASGAFHNGRTATLDWSRSN